MIATHHAHVLIIPTPYDNPMPVGGYAMSRWVRCLLLLRSLDRVDLFQPSGIAFPLIKFRAKELAGQLHRQGRADDPRPQAKDIHIVVLDALAGAVRVVTQPRTYPFHLIGRHTRSHPAATQQDPTLGLTVLDGLADVTGVIRVIIVWLYLMGAQVEHLMAQRLEESDEFAFEWKAAVVTSNRYFHRSHNPFVYNIIGLGPHDATGNALWAPNPRNRSSTFFGEAHHTDYLTPSVKNTESVTLSAAS